MSNKEKTPFWVWVVVLGTLSIGTSVIISNSNIGEKPKTEKVDATVGSSAPASNVERTDFSAYYIQQTDFLCNGKPKEMAMISTYRGIDVLAVDKSDGHIYNIAAFNKKFGQCVPTGLGIRRVTTTTLDGYYNPIIDRLYPNNVR